VASPHWIHEESQQHGCQATGCRNAAVHQWQRAATEAEIEAEANIQGPYGQVYRNPEGPHRTAVFACQDHILDIDNMVYPHTAHCPAPDPGCECSW
jgi:hypothetical protein